MFIHKKTHYSKDYIQFSPYCKFDETSIEILSQYILIYILWNLKSWFKNVHGTAKNQEYQDIVKCQGQKMRRGIWLKTFKISRFILKLLQLRQGDTGAGTDKLIHGLEESTQVETTRVREQELQISGERRNYSIHSAGTTSYPNGEKINKMDPHLIPYTQQFQVDYRRKIWKVKL